MAVFSGAFILQCSKFLLFAPVICLFKIYIYLCKKQIVYDTYYYDY